jgi:hypothetical protein
MTAIVKINAEKDVEAVEKRRLHSIAIEVENQRLVNSLKQV